MPPNEVGFKLSFDVKQEGGHYLKVKYNWFKVTPGDAEVTVEATENDSGFMKDWTLIQIEGEEAVEAAVEDPKAKDTKKAPAKGGKAAASSALEEITDNRPRTIKFEKDFGEELGKVQVTEKVAHYLETFLLKVGIYDTNRETQEETLLEEQHLDMSQLLFMKDKDCTLEWKFDKCQTQAIHYLNITVATDESVLTNFLRKKLNPLQVNLVACKSIPYKTEPRFKPIHAVFDFVDGRSFKTSDMP